MLQTAQYLIIYINFQLFIFCAYSLLSSQYNIFNFYVSFLYPFFLLSSSLLDAFCCINDSYGTNERKKNMMIVGHPDQVHNCTVTNISMTSMSVRCSEGFNGGLQQQFMLEVRDLQTNELRANYSSPVPRFTVNSLMPSAIYLASVYAFNAKGRSDPTVVQAAMLRMPEKQPTGEKGKYKCENLLSSTNVLHFCGN